MPREQPLDLLWFTYDVSSKRVRQFSDLRLPSWVKSAAVAWKSVYHDSSLTIVVICDNCDSREFVVEGIKYIIVNRGLTNLFKRWWYKFNHKISTKDELSQFLEIIERQDPDVIHLYGSESSYVQIISHTQRPVLLHVQGIISEYIKVWNALGISKWKMFIGSGFLNLIKGSGVYHAYQRFIKQAIREKESLRHLTYVSGRTEWDKESIKQLSPDAIYFSIPEIMRKSFYSEDWKYLPEAGKFRILTIINPNIYKGLDIIRDCLKDLARDNFRWEWNIIGIHPTDNLVSMFNLQGVCRSNNARITFHGPLMEEQMISLMKASDLYVHPSYIENSSNAICEAMLMGLPVVASSGGGTSSIVRKEITGLLFTPGDYKALAGHIRSLAKDESRLEKMGKEAKKDIMEKLDPLSIVQKLNDAYHQILQSSLNNG